MDSLPIELLVKIFQYVPVTSLPKKGHPLYDMYNRAARHIITHLPPNANWLNMYQSEYVCIDLEMCCECNKLDMNEFIQKCEHCNRSGHKFCFSVCRICTQNNCYKERLCSKCILEYCSICDDFINLWYQKHADQCCIDRDDICENCKNKN